MSSSLEKKKLEHFSLKNEVLLFQVTKHLNYSVYINPYISTLDKTFY